MSTPLSTEEIDDIEEVVSMAGDQFSPWARRRIADLIFSLRYYMNEAEATAETLSSYQKTRCPHYWAEVSNRCIFPKGHPGEHRFEKGEAA